MDNQQFQAELQQILNNMLYENIWNNTNQNYIPRNNAQYRRNPFANETHNNTLLQGLRDIMRAYGENMREYSTNVRLYLQIMDLMMRESGRVQPVEPRTEGQRPRSRVRTQTQTQMPQFLSYTFYPLRDASGNFATRRQPQQFQDVIIRPTEEQINQATRSFTYNNDTIVANHRCPISLEDFEEGDTIRQINHCGHAFSEASIQNWFQSNVRCPVCRHDIRQTRQRTSDQDVSGNLTEATTLNHMLDGLTENISNIINNYANSEMETNITDLVYNFEIPIYYNDLSGNLS